MPYLSIKTADPATGSVITTPGFLTNTEFIALTTNACYTGNTALVSTWGDPGGQLEWLVGKLKDARNNGNSVILAGHLPPGDLHCNA